MKREAADNSRQVRWRERNPWARLVEHARRRCGDSDPEGKWYPYYFAKGIRVELTAAQLRAVWGRDGADKLKRPSLDRIDESRNYTIDNVRIVEFDWNSRRAWDKALDLADESKCEFR